MRIIVPISLTNGMFMPFRAPIMLGLWQQGAGVWYLPGFIHAKQIVSDDKIAVVGTTNMDYRSFICIMNAALCL